MKKLALTLAILSLSAADMFGQESSVIVTTRDGACDTCRILYADSSRLVLWKCDTPFTVGSAGECAVELQPSEIERIVIQREGHFWSAVGTGFVIGAGAGAVLGLASGDDKSGFLKFTAGEKALMGGAFFGVAGALMGVIVGGAQAIGYDYKLNGKYERYIHVLPELKGASMFKSSPPPRSQEAAGEYGERVPQNSKPAPEEKDKLWEPSFSRFHISASECLLIAGPGADDIATAFNSSGFGGGGWFATNYPVDESKNFSVNVSADYSLTEDMRIGLAWSGIPSQIMEGSDRETEGSGGNIYALLFTYVPYTATPLVAPRGEFALSAGVSFNSLYVDGTISTWSYSPGGPAPVIFHDEVNAVGLIAQVSYDYYLWSHFSIQCNARENFIPSSLNVREVRYTNPADGSIKTLTPHSVNFSGLSLSIGARLHF